MCCLTLSPAIRVIPDAGSASADYPDGTVLLDTHLLYGEISHDEEDVQLIWEKGWRPYEKTVQDLAREWRSTPVAKVQFVTDGLGSVNCKVFEVKPCKNGLCPWLCALFILCLCWCFKIIKECVIACLHLIWAMLTNFYEWLSKK